MNVLDLGEEVDFAAKSLPENWQITIEIEQGSATVSLYDDDGDEVEIFWDGSIAAQVADATEYATGVQS
jgi:hypothetical protein